MAPCAMIACASLKLMHLHHAIVTPGRVILLLLAALRCGLFTRRRRA